MGKLLILDVSKNFHKNRKRRKMTPVLPIWAAHYIGIPFADHGRNREGLDGWGIVRLICAEQFGIALPSFQKLVNYQVLDDISGWRHLKTIRREEVKVGDIAFFLTGKKGNPDFGLCIGSDRMIICPRTRESSIIDYSSKEWMKDVIGFKRLMTGKENWI